MSTDDQRGHPSRRWRLHRGGIINIWQYAEHTFDLSGGRAIFQGTNGSGKSRTLELLLPLCLDGDLRQLGSKGFDTVSIRRLMLDEYPGGPNRVGYAWIELCRETPSGEQEFLTCGVGVKASKTAQAISDSWRFITTERVGIDLHLVGPDRVPLGPAQLRELLGADGVLDDPPFRARIAATVYGVPAARYTDLLHLQRTLRNPDVGLKVLEGQLEQILSDALPPLDTGLIERLATSFDDLESIRENIIRLTSADTALGEFLTTYSGYAFAALRDRSETMHSAARRLHSVRGELAALDEQLETKRSERESAQQTIADLEKREGELESSIEALRAHPAYTELQNLHDRQRLVDSTRTAATAALDTAMKHRAQEDRSAESVVGALRRLAGDADAAEQAAVRADGQLATAGLDGPVLHHPPTIQAAETVIATEQVRSAPEPDAPPQPIDRHIAPQVDIQELTEQLRATVRESHHASTIAKQRGALTLALHQQALEMDAEQGKVSDLQRQARQAQLTATEAAGRRNQAAQELADAAAEWSGQAQAWVAHWPSSTSDTVPAPSAEDLSADRSASRQALEQVRDWARPQLHETRQRVTESQQRLDDLRRKCAGCEAELAELRAGHDPAPARPDWTAADRTDGAAFYRLVDFQPALTTADQAGLEAALQASGLLNAWVTAAGTVSEFPDLLAEPTAAYAEHTLADLLRPAPEPDCPVPSERVAALLASVSINSEPGFAVSVTGGWQAGVLSGKWHKDTAEYVGAGARAAGRARRVRELEDSLSELRVDIGRAEESHREATQHAAELEQYLESYPDDRDLLTAHAKLATATEAAEDAAQQAVQLRAQHEHADQRGQAVRNDVARSAAEADLPADSQILEAAHKAASEADSATEALREVIESRCLPTLADFHNLSLHHDVAVADRMEAETQAEARCSEYGEQAAALTQLTAAVGNEAQQIADTITELDRERTQAREQLPQLREGISELREVAARLETQWENKQDQLPIRRSEADTATESFRNALHTPGLWSAAQVSEEAVPDDLALAAELFSADRKGFTETTVLNRLQTTQSALSGNYDISAGEQHGLLTITVTGEEGPRPVAEAARLVSDRLGQQRNYLNERYQSIFADYLIRDLAERLRDQITIAEDLCTRMNEVLDGARSSQGVHVRLEWQPSAALGPDIREAIELVRTPLAHRSEDQDTLLRRVFTDLIESERDSAAGGYAEILARALDYRSWFAFTVRVRDTGPEGKARVRRLRQLSSGETRLISYVTLFAAAAAFYDAVSANSGDQGTLRLVLLDEAFERLDDPTIARMLGLLVDLDMDWMITWPSGWGVSPKIPKMHIYDVLRPSSGHGIACTQTTWNGQALDRND